MGTKKSRELFFIELVILNISFCGYYVYFMSTGYTFFSYNYIALIVISNLLWFFISINSSLHALTASTSVTQSMKSLFTSFSSLTVILIVILAVFGDFKNNNKIILLPILAAGVASVIIRLSFLLLIKRFSQREFGQKTLLVIGGGRVAAMVIEKVLANPFSKYKLHGVLADKFHATLPKELHIGTFNQFCEIVRSTHIDEVIIALPLRHEQNIIEIVNKCNYEGIRLRIVPDFFRIVQNRMEISSLDDIPLISIQTEPLNALGNRIQKRILDVTFSIIIMFLLSPVFFIIAVLLKLSSPGPIIFKQKRVGTNNKEFTIYKFRTMRVQSKKITDRAWTTSNDPRITKFGSFLRRTNLDELPQFWNVLKGNMSVVGPRPELNHFVEQFKEEITNYKVRHLIKPGITGWAQINGYRGDTSIPARIKHDIYYLQNWSIGFDIKIIFLTVFNKSAYKHAC